MIRLLIRQGEESREIEFIDETISMGRSTDSSIVVSDKKASRKHAKIEKVGAEYKLTDLESNNGTKVNGKPVVFHTLATGDEVRIGDVTLTVVQCDTPFVAAAPPPPPVPEEVVEKEPVPFDKKLEIKKKIEGVRSATEEARQRAVVPQRVSILRKLASIAAALAVLVAAVAGVVYVINTKDDSSVPKTVKKAADVTLDEAKQALEELKTDVAAATTVTPEILARAMEGSNKYGSVFPRQVVKDDQGVERETTSNPFDQIVTELMQKQAEDFAKIQRDVNEKVEASLATKKYGEAIATIEKFYRESDVAFQEAAKELMDRVNGAVKSEFENVMAVGRRYEGSKMYEAAKKHYAANADAFAGTEYFAIINKKPGDMDLLARADAEKAEPVVRKEEPKKEEPIVKEDPKKEEPRKEEPKKEEPKKVDSSALMTKVIDAVNAGKYTSPVKLTDNTTGIPESADAEYLTLKDGVKLNWNEVTPLGHFNLMINSGVKDDELLAVADWAHSKGLNTEANKTLNRYIAGKKENRAKADELIARWRGLPKVPEGGYAYNPKTASWEDKSELANREALDRTTTLCKSLAAATDPKQMDKTFGELLAFYNDTSLKSQTRESVKAQTLDALRTNKKKKIDAIARKAKSAGGFEQVRAAKLELNRRREVALKTIYDVKIYLPESHPDWPKGDKINGQKQVDDEVGAVRDLWEKAGQFVASLDGSISKDIESVQAINEKYLAELGEKPSEDDLKDFEEVTNNLNRAIDLKSFAISGKEAEIWSWNRRVEKYNEAISEPGVTKEEKAHAKVLNDYREMMGRKRVFLDARLCRATNKHSAACSAAGRIWHVGSDGDPQSRAKAEGFTAGVGENVAIGYGHPSDIWWRGWYRASDHHRNGLSDAWNCMGYGFVGSVGTQNFSNTGTPKGFPGK